MRELDDAWKLVLGAFLVCLPLLVAGGQAPPNAKEDLQARFEHETDPVRKAKMMQQLGREQFEEIQEQVSKENLPAALRALDQYRDDVQTCIKGLDAAKINASKHSSGFKQLQISLREALRRLDEIIAGFTSDQQPPFLAVRGDLKQMNDHLVEELFPGPAARAPE